MHDRDLMKQLVVPILLSIIVTLTSACEGGRSEIDEFKVPGGDAQQGAVAIEMHGCGACHTIPGIDNAAGTIGPPLTSWSKRSFIAGNVPNSPDNLVQWIMHPHSVEPGTAMPNLEVSEQQARDIAAYLYTLE